jgi:hypothetical protein
LLNRVDGKLRANDLTIMAVHTVIVLLYPRGMIALLIIFCGKLQDSSGTEFDAIAAALAPVLEDMNLSTRDLKLFRIQRNPPKYHGPVLK